MRSGHIRVTPGSFLQGAYSFAPIARKFRYCIAEAAAEAHIPAQTPCQAQKHPSSKVHMATCPRSKVHTAAPCSGTSTQALKRTQQRHAATRQHPSSPAHPVAAPAPKLERASTQLFLHWNNSGALQRHQHPRSKTHTCSSSYT